MAEFKTAEQYVVAKLEMTEMELDSVNIEHKAEMDRTLKELADLKAELDQAYNILNMFRDYVSISKSEYFGSRITIDGTIYAKEKPEEAALITEYFDLRLEEDE